jgi:Trk K+ transport system NAD-binding subunit
VMVALTRAGQATIPSGETILAECDVVLISASHGRVESLRERLSRPEES